MATDLRNLFEKHKYDASIALKSKSWFQQQALLLSKAPMMTPNNILRHGNKTSRIVPGKLYMFLYDPKGKDTLPHYDRFPLVFPYAKTKDGFIGLNLHYLPYFYRVQLMTRLMQYATNDKMDENTRLRYSWSLINGVSKFSKAQVCIKSYLLDHVESQFVEVPGNDWHTAMMLPVERFVGANKSNVWELSKKV